MSIATETVRQESLPTTAQLICQDCGKSHPLDTSVSLGNVGNICSPCHGAWRLDAAGCQHSFRPGTNGYGDPGQVCPKCRSFRRGLKVEPVPAYGLDVGRLYVPPAAALALLGLVLVGLGACRYAGWL